MKFRNKDDAISPKRPDKIIKIIKLKIFLGFIVLFFLELLVSSSETFSILTSSKYECLALDEGFGASDASFFEKAKKRLEDFIEQSGSLFLASHSDELLLKFCKRGLVFKNGEIVFDSNIKEAIKKYHELHN